MDFFITPSILNSDLANLATEVNRIPSADWLHLDVMDGHFVPNLTLGLPVVEMLARHTSTPFDMHLMIENPDQWAPQYAEAGCHSVTFHVEAAKAPIRLARTIRKLGAKAAIGLNPTTSIESYACMLDEVDSVLIMTIEPGFGGQAFMDFTLPKIARTRELIGDREIRIQVDGGVSLETIERCVEAGADTFVAGSAVFNATDPDVMVNQLRQAASACCGTHKHG